MGNKSIEIFLNVIRNDEMAKCLSETKTCWNVLMLWQYHSTGLIGMPDKNFLGYAVKKRNRKAIESPVILW